MFKIESYITPILLSYVDKYVRDFKPADAQVSLWGGGVALHNLVLKADVLQEEVALPFTLVSGRIHELLIQVPWTKIMSEPIVVTIDTIECILSLNPPSASDESLPPESPSRKAQSLEAPPGYMQALVRRIVSNIALRVHHLIVKYVQDDIVLSLNVKHLSVDSAGINWEPSFADIDANEPVLRRLVSLDDLTLCLDKADSDGKIRFYQEPLLYRCKLELRVLTRLVSANTRRASSLSIQLLSSKLAWGVTSDQLTLLVRLIKERPVHPNKPPTPAPLASNSTTLPLNSSNTNTAEPTRSESWSEWAWSWLPAWADREGIEEAPVVPAPIPIYFTAYFDDVNFTFKIMDTDTGRKRARPVIELTATHAAIKSYVCSPITTRIRMGARSITVFSTGKCVCGFTDFNAFNEEPTVYIRQIQANQSSQDEEPWAWPEDRISNVVETALAIDEHYTVNIEEQEKPEESKPEAGLPEEPSPENKDQKDDGDKFWEKMSPQLYMDFSHERSHPQAYANPFDNPPIDFEYSDWVEERIIKVTSKPVEIRICMGLVHRVDALLNIFKQLPAMPVQEMNKKVLTVEECESLSDNLPQWRMVIEANGLLARIIPWDHSERACTLPITLDVDFPKNAIYINGPLYPHRVCSAACQMPNDSGSLWQGSRLHFTLNMSGIRASVCAPAVKTHKTCARADLRAVAHVLLYKHYFSKRESVELGYSIKISEASISGSLARMQAAFEIPVSLLKQKMSPLLRHSSLSVDALNDENSVMLDVALEDLVIKGYQTKNIITHIITLQSAKAMNMQELKRGDMKQAFLFSAPDSPRSASCLRAAVQWCREPITYSIDYIGIWTEPTAIAIDPLFIAWLMYTPNIKYYESGSSQHVLNRPSSSVHFLKRRVTPPSSSGRGASKSGGSATELVHMRPRSIGSSGKPEGASKPHIEEAKKPNAYWSEDRLLALHERLRRMYFNVELGLTLVYFTLTSASAIDCETIRDTMERHASQLECVLTVSLGRLLIFSSTIKKQFWHEINHEGPTFITRAEGVPLPESFPWKMRLADVSCYTLEVITGTDRYGRDRAASGLKSQIKATLLAKPRTILELVSTTVTLSVVTKTLQIKTMPKVEKIKVEEPSVEEKRTKYFKSGINFKPTTLKEFLRGPTNIKKPPQEPDKKPDLEPEISTGPVVSLGMNIHADTPPLVFRLEQDQLHLVVAVVHSISHIVEIIRRPMHMRRTTVYGSSSRSLGRSASDLDGAHTPSEETLSENRSAELVSIFEAQSATNYNIEMKTFFWFQWVISRVTFVLPSNQIKLVFDADDIINTVDIQTHYNQYKVKVASASIKYHQRCNSDEWEAGVLGGRILEAREPTSTKEENHFLGVTITQAQISNLPASWKEELHPKLLEEKSSLDSMWEIYATLAPLEIVLQPMIMKQIQALIRNMTPRASCPIKKNTEKRLSSRWQWPFCYVAAGGIRLVITSDYNNSCTDDSFVLTIGKTTVSPHPENPICRRAVGSGVDNSWIAANGGYEGRQYEITIQKVSLSSVEFRQIVELEGSESELRHGTAGENPAVKWAQEVVTPILTPILHSVDIGCVLAPVLYVNGVLTCGPAVELNLLTDCALEISIDQLALCYTIYKDFSEPLEFDDDWFLYDEDLYGKCPVATFGKQTSEDAEPFSIVEETEIIYKEPTTEVHKSVSEMIRSTADSGVETITSSTSKHFRLQDDFRDNSGSKKTVSIANDFITDPLDFLEVFVTMGIVELSLYTIDDNSDEVVSLRPPNERKRKVQQETEAQAKVPSRTEVKESASAHDSQSASESKSAVRLVAMERNTLDLPVLCNLARENEGNVPLLHIVLYQPNLYYWKNKAFSNLQVSLFNAWIGLGAGNQGDMWNEPLLKTAKGVIDPVTEIPPALATLKIVMPCAGAMLNCPTSKGNIQLDVERPVMLEVSVDRVKKLITLFKLLKRKIHIPSIDESTTNKDLPFLYKLRKTFVHNAIESMTIQLTQIGVCGSDGVAGWDSASLQIAAGSRPDRLSVRALLSALTVSTGTMGDTRHVLLQPLMAGAELEATWEVWRRAEGGASAWEPSVRASFDFDYITIDLRPTDVTTVMESIQAFKPVLDEFLTPSQQTDSMSFSSLLRQSDNFSTHKPQTNEKRPSTGSVDYPDEHYYKDDLRSGAFKIVCGGQLPMAYQVTLYKNIVSWRYPHPRAITRLIAFPLPGQDKETSCVLELYNPLLNTWDKHTDFKIPVSEPTELLLYTAPPNAVFGVMWRYRVCEESNEVKQPFEFNVKRFQPRSDPLVNDHSSESCIPNTSSTVTAEELSGVIRVDSCFSPRVASLVNIVSRIANFAIYLHNNQPPISSQNTTFEGYYVSKPLMRSHRVLRLAVRDATAHAQLASPAGILLLLDTNVSSDIMECTTGTMEQLVKEFHVKGGVSIPSGAMARARVAVTRMHVAMHVPRLRTVHSLAKDWIDAIQPFKNKQSDDATTEEPKIVDSNEIGDVQAALEGRISMWVQNNSISVIKIGQEGTDEVVPLGPGACLAYRWRSPTAEKKLRFALAGPQSNWQWSNSIPFECNTYRVRLHKEEDKSEQIPSCYRLYLYAKVEDIGSRRKMTLSGRLTLANMLRFNLHYKVRARCTDTKQWQTVCYGEIANESLGGSVICEADCEMALKVKFTSQENGWSGDIPLKECPKENVPWLVKVPSEGETPYMSVWCRVVRATSDSRVIATMWPLYVLYSHLPLDVDVLIVTESIASNEMVNPPPPLLQSAPGRGATTHILAPGTTAARHSILFQYRNIECPVTREAVPLHYGVTDTSVFDKRAPVNSIDDVILDINEWLKRSNRHAKSSWPYSVVTSHWPGDWQPALLQPKSDVTVRYFPVRAGGGCSLEVQLCPVVILCNSAPIALTLRAHDAAPLCKLEPGTAISPPSTILTKPFFISVELGRETFVSSELSVCGTELGRYGEPPPGKIAVDRAAQLAIFCNKKVALLSIYYEIKEDINVLGITSTYTVLNRMGKDIWVSATAIPNDMRASIVVHPQSYTIIKPTKEDSTHGTSLCRFDVQGRWCGSDPRELRLYVCVKLESKDTVRTLPIRVGHAPYRRPFTLFDENGLSIPVVLCQVKQDGRWLLSVSHDPCPQFIIHNRTPSTVAIAQPATQLLEPSTSRVMVQSESSGSYWQSVIEPGAVTHYSTPDYCSRYPPESNSPPYRPKIAFLTFAKAYDDDAYVWCEPIGVTDGEQLVQLYYNTTLKIRVRIHPHSTYLEIRTVEEHDISASDIRNRLGAFSSTEFPKPYNLERVAGDAKLIKSPNQTSDIGGASAIEEPINQLPTDRGSKKKITIASDHKDVHSLSTEHTKMESTSTAKKSTQFSISETGMKTNRDGDVTDVTAVTDPKEKVTSVTDDKEIGDEDKSMVNSDNLSQRRGSPSTLLLYAEGDDINDIYDDSKRVLITESNESAGETSVFKEVTDPEWEEWSSCDRIRVIATGIVVDMASTADTRPLFALYLDRAALLVRSDVRRTKVTVSIGELQVDNLQYENGLYDFGVIASTRTVGTPDVVDAPSPTLWNIFKDNEAFAPRLRDAHALIRLTQDLWSEHTYTYRELTEVEIRVGPLSLYVEDAYVSAVANLWRRAMPQTSDICVSIIEEQTIRSPLRLRSLHIHPLDLTLTLHTAVRMYIALDQSPLRLNSFKLQDAMTSTERLTHALTVHYLSAAIFGAGWVVGGLELLGAPGALAARVGGARGGVRGVASAAAAALVRSLSACAGSLARNLDLLAGDEEHARRAAAARRRPPPSLMAGLAAGVTNFAINILGAVGGLAHHPLVGVAVGETESGTSALRRGLIGALAKPLSATADLVAYAGHGLLTQTGWDPIPQPRSIKCNEGDITSGWRRDCVRWSFRLAEITAISGYHVLVDLSALHLLLTHKFLVVADPETERIVEMIDFRYCSIGPYQGQIIELQVTQSQRRQSKSIYQDDKRATDDDDEVQVCAAAMARVARYTGAGVAGTGEIRLLSLMPAPGHSHSLHAALTTAIHNNRDSHFPML